MSDDIRRGLGRRHPLLKPLLKELAEGWPVAVRFSEGTVQVLLALLREVLLGVLQDPAALRRAETELLSKAENPESRGTSLTMDFWAALEAAAAVEREPLSDPVARRRTVEQLLMAGRQLSIHEFGLAQLWAEERIHEWQPSGTHRWERDHAVQIQELAAERLRRALVDRTLGAPSGPVESPGAWVRGIIRIAIKELLARQKREPALVGTDVESMQSPPGWRGDADESPELRQDLWQTQRDVLERVRKRLPHLLNEPNLTRAEDLLEQAIEYAEGRRSDGGLLAWQVLKPHARGAVPAAREWLRFYAASSRNPRAAQITAESFDKRCGRRLRELYQKSFGHLRGKHLANIGALTLFGLSQASFAEASHAIATGVDVGARGAHGLAGPLLGAGVAPRGGALVAAILVATLGGGAVALEHCAGTRDGPGPEGGPPTDQVAYVIPAPPDVAEEPQERLGRRLSPSPRIARVPKAAWDRFAESVGAEALLVHGLERYRRHEVLDSERYTKWRSPSAGDAGTVWCLQVRGGNLYCFAERQACVDRESSFDREYEDHYSWGPGDTAFAGGTRCVPVGIAAGGSGPLELDCECPELRRQSSRADELRVACHVVNPGPPRVFVPPRSTHHVSFGGADVELSGSAAGEANYLVDGGSAFVWPVRVKLPDYLPAQSHGEILVSSSYSMTYRELSPSASLGPVTAESTCVIPGLN